MLITLTGFMGSGKTTVGRILADALGCPFLDLDDLIVKKAGKSIPDIFAQDGEPAFRQLEARLLRQTVEKYGESTAVLSLGGGAILAPASAMLVHEKTVCIYLRATLDTLLSRLAGESAGRPLLQEIPDQVGDDGSPVVMPDGSPVVMPGPDRASVAARLVAREPLYEKTAHVVIDTDGLTLEDVSDEIIISCL
jgi:shikimate kinase